MSTKVVGFYSELSKQILLPVQGLESKTFQNLMALSKALSIPWYLVMPWGVGSSNGLDQLSLGHVNQIAI